MSELGWSFVKFPKNIRECERFLPLNDTSINRLNEIKENMFLEDNYTYRNIYNCFKKIAENINYLF